MVQFMEKTLFVGDLSKLCEEAQLFSLFSNYGTIIATKIVRGFDNISLSYGFVVMSTEDEVRNAINYLNGVLFMGRYIKVAHAVRNELNTKRKKFKKQFINSIYVRFRCLSHNTDISESRFRSIFEQFGRVDDVSNKKVKNIISLLFYLFIDLLIN